MPWVLIKWGQRRRGKNKECGKTLQPYFSIGEILPPKGLWNVWTNTLCAGQLIRQEDPEKMPPASQKRRPEDRLPADNTAASPPPKGVCLFCRIDKFFFKKIRTFHMNPSNHKSDSDQRLVA